METVDYLKTLEILYVEDDEFVRRVLSSGFLKNACKRVYAAENGEEGLRLFNEKRPDIVISDIKMPVMDGVQMVTEIRKISDVPIILTTAFNESEYLLKAIDLGVTHYVLKPINNMKLLEYLEKIAENIKLKHDFRSSHVLLQQYKFAVDTSAIVSKTDTDGTITYVNDTFCEISGYGKHELLGQPHNIVRHPDMPKEAFADLWSTIKQKKPWHGIVKNRKKNGDVYFVDTNICPILDSDGSVAEYIGIRRNVTDMIMLHEEIEDTQKELIYKMGETAESRSKETGNHIRRVAHYSRLLALKAGLPEAQADILFTASPMHDIGKIAIPDHVLLKPGMLNEEEWAVMSTHCEIGYNILKNSGRPILKAAATVAYEHHERWDGGGYPRGVGGEEIHIFGRICAIVDVFDALGSDRVYKKAWELPKIIDFIAEEKGRHFDPQLVDLFLGNLDEFLTIRHTYNDDF